METFSVQCLGVGDGRPCADRSHSAYLYQFGSLRLLIDCGEPLCRNYKAAGLSFEDLDLILLSHFHFDHVGGFFMFIQGSWLEGRRRRLPVHLPGGGIEAMRQILRVACLFDELLPFPIQFLPLQPQRAIEHGPLRITPFLTTHLEPFRKAYEKKYPGNFEAFSFLLETDRIRVGHTADLGAPQDLAPMLTRPLDLLVCELAHFEPEALFNYLAGQDVKRVAFTHLGRPYWENLEQTVRQAETMLPGKSVLFPREQAILTL